MTGARDGKARGALADVRRLRDELHGLFADVTVPQPGRGGQVAVDVIDEPGSIEIRIDFLAVAPDSLDVEIDGDVLHFHGQRVIEADEAEHGNRRHQRKRWEFSRSVRLPPTLAHASARPHYERGLLTVWIRKQA